MILPTVRACPTRSKRTGPCGRRLALTVAQEGEHAAHWIEACFACGYERALDDEEAAAAEQQAQEAATA